MPEAWGLGNEGPIREVWLWQPTPWRPCTACEVPAEGDVGRHLAPRREASPLVRWPHMGPVTL